MKLGGLVLVILGIFLVSALSVTAQTTRPVYKVEVEDLHINPFELQCKETINGILTVVNEGNLDATVAAGLINDELNIETYSPSIRLPPGRQQGIVLQFRIDKETAGAYEFDILLYTDEGIERLYQTVHFRGCPKPTITSLIPEVEHIEEKKDVEEQTIPASLLIAIGLGGLVACLSVLFLILSYFQETQQEE